MGLTMSASRHTLVDTMLQSSVGVQQMGEARRVSFGAAAGSATGGLSASVAGGRVLGLPCLVFLAQRIPKTSAIEGEKLARSFLVIDSEC